MSIDDYTLEAKIISTRANPNANIDIGASVLEVILYEDITRAAIMGELAVIDTASQLANLNLAGTERVKLTFKFFPSNKEITKTFIMSSIKSIEKVNDDADVYIFELMEEHMFVNMLQSVSKAYEGNSIDIIERIIDEKLKTDNTPELGLDRSLMGTETPIQSDMRIVSPYWRPLKIIDWVRDRTTTDNGYPYFVFATLKSPKIFINDLHNMLTSTASNSTPFVYSQASTNTSEAQQERKYIIQKYESNPDQSSTITSVNAGAVASDFFVKDITVDRSVTDTGSHFKVKEILSSLANGANSRHSLYDETTVFKDLLIEDHTPVNYFTVVSGMSYEDYATYHDDNNINNSVTKIKNKALRTAMLRGAIKIQTEGGFFAETGTTVGSQINIRFNNTQGRDVQKSGTYLITAIRHVFGEGKHSANLSLTKLINTSSGDESSLRINIGGR